MAVDEVFVHLAADDDERAAEVLVARHERELRRWLSQLLNAEAEVDEVYQAVLVRTFRHLGKVDRSEEDADRRLRAWLFRITRREAYRHLAKRARRRAHEQRLETREAAMIQATGPGPSTNLRDRDEREKRVEALESVLAELRPQDASLILLRFRQECSCAQIAERLSTPDAPLSEATVRQRLSRATRRLKAKAEEAGLG